MLDNGLPEQLSGLKDGTLYAVDEVAKIWHQYPNTMAYCVDFEAEHHVGRAIDRADARLGPARRW